MLAKLKSRAALRWYGLGSLAIAATGCGIPPGPCFRPGCWW